MTLKLGIIGTNWITKMFVEAALATKQYELVAVYSRTEAKGQDFTTNFAGDQAVWTDLNDFLQSGIDVVYIASPNSLHFEQAYAAIEAGVNVIVEKSAFDNPEQYEKIYSLLQKNPTVKLFEAARHIYQDNFKIIEQKVNQMAHISGATFVYEKYSSRFDDYLAGKKPNVLSREFSAGALADLGVYPLYAAIKLFGLPDDQFYFATLLDNGADGRGTVILRYPKFDVTLIFGKSANSYELSEIHGRRDTIVIDNIAELGEVKYDDGQGNVTVISQPAPDNPMVQEAEFFANILQNKLQTPNDYEEATILSQKVNLVLTKLRHSAGIKFPSDQ
ncbi:Gfo/Idh/MocA family oxidoreductase [Weissella coleopterorum]|uniref:Gfo/Idh/MocA family oxidoreductase n=1 Tax=Weissella coleopterorum TaxID=2714949 RepID=A0A6G8AZM2_9LACO|nr:Gfo/Idh/MocA family oxidoreductase [Weissella coleopterorum]QIL50412.1 Gfo/Idh/MocA family oxidoreductase [Weissella coleopterorum]